MNLPCWKKKKQKKAHLSGAESPDGPRKKTSWTVPLQAKGDGRDKGSNNEDGETDKGGIRVLKLSHENLLTDWMCETEKLKTAPKFLV